MSVIVALPTRQILDQGTVNCCLSCALASAMEAADRTSPALAPLFHFYFAGGQSALTAGVTVSQAQGALLQRGICALTRHPYRIAVDNVGRTPDADALTDGARRRPIDADSGTLQWKPMSTAAPGTWVRMLSAGYPIVITLQTNADYHALTAASPTLRGNAGPYDSTGHASTVIGCRDRDRLFIVQDSRGTAFGAHGQWFLPYDLCTSPFIVLAFALAPDAGD